MFKVTSDNPNYLASIVKIDSFSKHPNPKVERLKIAAVYGNSIITTIDKEPGLYCYFPLESAIAPEFISFMNGFVNKDLNEDNTIRGYFESHGRVRAARLQGHPSQGFIIPVNVLEDFIQNRLKLKVKIDDSFLNKDFDTIGEFILCKKYVPRGTRTQNSSGKTKGKIKKFETKIVEGQCHFHLDTSHLKREVSNISPEDDIVVSSKIHGSSFWVSHVLTKRKLSWKDRIAKFLGVSVNDTEYGMMYGSRKVVKSAKMDTEHNHFYDSDIWKTIADKLFPCLKVGYTFYGEVFGYTPSGSFIQKNYDYGMAPGQMGYIIYRMTFTNVKGEVFELSHDQMVAYCNSFGLNVPQVFYKGKAKDHFNIPVDTHWHQNFLDNMINSYLEKDCPLCKTVPNTPDEGVILRKEAPNTWQAYKLKSFRFLEGERDALDKGESNIEDEQSSVEE